jgi:hypothetical protein
MQIALPAENPNSIAAFEQTAGTSQLYRFHQLLASFPPERSPQSDERL